MTYKQVKNLKEKEFKRLCGIKPRLFQEMVKVLDQCHEYSRFRS